MRGNQIDKEQKLLPRLTFSLHCTAHQQQPITIHNLVIGMADQPNAKPVLTILGGRQNSGAATRLFDFLEYLSNQQSRDAPGKDHSWHFWYSRAQPTT